MTARPAGGGDAATPARPGEVHLADVQRLLALFTQGLSGRYLHLKPADALTGDFRPTGATTDGSAVYLPVSVAVFDNPRHNLGLYRISVLHQLGFYENGSFDFSLAQARALLDTPDAGLPPESGAALPAGTARVLPERAPTGNPPPTELERFFRLWSSPRLMRQLFMTLEDLRIDTAMRWRYPGARADLERVLAQALAARPPLLELAATASPAALLFEALVQFTLGARVADLVAQPQANTRAHPLTQPLAKPLAHRLPPLLAELLAELLAAVAPLTAGPCSVYDSARAAVLAYRLLVRAATDADEDTEAGLADDPATAPAEGAPAPAGPGGDEAGDAPPSLDDLFEGLPVDFRGEVRPELVQRRLRAGHTGSLLDAQAADADAPGPPEPAERARLEREQQADLSALRRAFGSTEGAQRSFLIDEWDYHRQGWLKGWCRLSEHRLRGDDFGFIDRVRERHADLARELRRQFKFIKPQSYHRVRRVSDGEELELDGVIEAVIDRRAGHATDEHVYRRRDRALREVSAAFLLDMSASTDFPVPDPDAPPPPPAPPPRPADGEFAYAFWHDYPEPTAPSPVPKRRVIDVAREALALMTDALQTLGDACAIYGFSGYGRADVEFHIAKEFEDPVSARTWSAMAAMQPRRSTRMGPAIRHALAKLERQPTRLKVLIIVSDGYPQDCDYGPDRNDDEYGIQDTAMALLQARHKGVQTFCITIDPSGHDYLRRMCPDEHYLVIDEVADLPRELTKVYRALTG